jgi:hypothetical protein
LTENHAVPAIWKHRIYQKGQGSGGRERSLSVEKDTGRGISIVHLVTVLPGEVCKHSIDRGEMCR